MEKKKGNLFFSQVHDIVSRIPEGKVCTYGQIAAFLGNPRSARMVGWAMHACPPGLPWYRVILKSGKLPFDVVPFDSTNQREKLTKEGISFLEDGTVDLRKHLWQIELP